MYKRKTTDTWVLYVDYGQGWEYETTEVTYKAYLENRREYRVDCPYPQKWQRKRSPRDA